MKDRAVDIEKDHGRWEVEQASADQHQHSALRHRLASSQSVVATNGKSIISIHHSSAMTTRETRIQDDLPVIEGAVRKDDASVIGEGEHPSDAHDPDAKLCGNTECYNTITYYSIKTKWEGKEGREDSFSSSLDGSIPPESHSGSPTHTTHTHTQIHTRRAGRELLNGRNQKKKTKEQEREREKKKISSHGGWRSGEGGWSNDMNKLDMIQQS